jgi:hypothetical protein
MEYSRECGSNALLDQKRIAAGLNTCVVEGAA